MEWLSDVFSFIPSVFSGGLFGLLGAIVQRWADSKNKKLDIEVLRERHAHEQALRKIDADIMRMEVEGKLRIAQVEASAKEDVGDTEAFRASFAMEPKLYSQGLKPNRAQAWLFVALDLIRGLVRPALTLYLCILTTLIYFQCRQIILDVGLMSVEEAFGLVGRVVETVLFLWTSCTLWWFGTRNKGKPPK